MKTKPQSTCLSDEQAAELIDSLLDPNDDDTARALLALIHRLAYDRDQMVRDTNAITLARAIYRHTAHCDAAMLSFAGSVAPDFGTFFGPETALRA